MKSMIREGGNLGINVPTSRPPIHFKEHMSTTEALRKLYEACDEVFKAKPDIIIMVYKDNDRGCVYNEVKFLAECKIG